MEMEKTEYKIIYVCAELNEADEDDEHKNEGSEADEEGATPK